MKSKYSTKEFDTLEEIAEYLDAMPKLKVLLSSYDNVPRPLYRYKVLFKEVISGEDGKDAANQQVESKDKEIAVKNEDIRMMKETVYAKIKEIERLKGLIGLAWQQSVINCDVENGAGDAGEQYVSWQQFKTENSL